MQTADDDLARRFLALAAAWTLAGRSNWSQAMLAELDQVAGYRARWRFTLDAVGVLLIPPRSRPAANVLAAGAVAAVLAIRLLAPQAGLVTAVVVPGLPALSAWVAAAWPYPPSRPSTIGRAVQVIAVAVITACPVLALRQIALYPGQAGGERVAGTILTVLFAAELACYLLLVLRRPGLMGGGAHGGLLGLAAALAVGAVFLFNQPSGGTSDNPTVNAAIILTAIGAPPAAGLVAAVTDLVRRRQIGQCLHHAAGEVIWAVLLTGPATFIVILLTTGRGAIAAEALLPVIRGEAQQDGATSVLAWVAADDLGGAIVVLTGLSFLGMLAFLVIHALFCLDPPEPLPVGPPARPPT